MLQAFPTNPKLVLREATADDDTDSGRQDAGDRREAGKGNRAQVATGRFGRRR
jgi:hypothetical protein